MDGWEHLRKNRKMAENFLADTDPLTGKKKHMTAAIQKLREQFTNLLEETENDFLMNELLSKPMDDLNGKFSVAFYAKKDGVFYKVKAEENEYGDDMGSDEICLLRVNGATGKLDDRLAPAIIAQIIAQILNEQRISFSQKD
jgi:hypothetical protein